MGDTYHEDHLHSEYGECILMRDIDTMEKGNCNGNHDHTPQGECLVIDWVGAETKKWEKGESQQEQQARVEANHKEQVKVWRQEIIEANTIPF